MRLMKITSGKLQEALNIKALNRLLTFFAAIKNESLSHFNIYGCITRYRTSFSSLRAVKDMKSK